MTENAKIARLWSGFHHLPDGHKELILKISELIGRPEKVVSDKEPIKGSRNIDTGKERCRMVSLKK
jgi:hypothetical protein